MASPRKTRKLSLANTDTGFPQHEEQEILQIMQQTFNRICANWNRIKEIRDSSDTGKMSFGLRITSNHAGKVPVTKVKISMRQGWDDEEEAAVEDPNQGALPLPE